MLIKKIIKGEIEKAGQIRNDYFEQKRIRNNMKTYSLKELIDKYIVEKDSNE